MTETSPVKVVAVSLGLSAFTLAILAGLAGGADGATILIRAIISMFVCVLIGYVIGVVGVSAMDEAARAHQESNPVPELDPMTASGHDERASAPSPHARAVA